MTKTRAILPLLAALFLLPVPAFTADNNLSLGVDISIAGYDLSKMDQYAKESWEYQMDEAKENIKTIQDNVKKIENSSNSSGGYSYSQPGGSGCDAVDFGDMACDDWMWMGCTGVGCAGFFLLIFWLTGTFG